MFFNRMNCTFSYIFLIVWIVNGYWIKSSMQHSKRDKFTGISGGGGSVPVTTASCKLTFTWNFSLNNKTLTILEAKFVTEWAVIARLPKICNDFFFFFEWQNDQTNIDCRILRYKNNKIDLSAGCTYSWATYAGVNSPGLVQQGAPNTYTQATCLTACIASSTCNSADFNSQDLTCWFGTAITPPRVANAPVTHFDLTRSCGR